MGNALAIRIDGILPELDDGFAGFAPASRVVTVPDFGPAFGHGVECGADVTLNDAGAVRVNGLDLLEVPVLLLGVVVESLATPRLKFAHKAEFEGVRTFPVPAVPEQSDGPEGAVSPAAAVHIGDGVFK